MFKKRTETRPENLDDWTDEEYEDWYDYIGDGLSIDEIDEQIRQEIHELYLMQVGLLCVMYFGTFCFALGFVDMIFIK